jgi:hypothetical protein
MGMHPAMMQMVGGKKEKKKSHVGAKNDVRRGSLASTQAKWQK